MANYIFGNNLAKGAAGSEKIAMTSPVVSEQQEKDFRSMKGGDGEKIAMTSPVGTDMQGSKCAPQMHEVLHNASSTQLLKREQGLPMQLPVSDLSC